MLTKGCYKLMKMAKVQEFDITNHMHHTQKRFTSLVSPTMQADRVKLSIMTTRSNKMVSPLYSSVGGPDELNGGFSTQGAATMKANLRNGRPIVPLAMDRNMKQKSEMTSMHDANKAYMPKLLLTQPLQFQKGQSYK